MKNNSKALCPCCYGTKYLFVDHPEIPHVGAPPQYMEFCCHCFGRGFVWTELEPDSQAPEAVVSQ